MSGRAAYRLAIRFHDKHLENLLQSQELGYFAHYELVAALKDQIHAINNKPPDEIDPDLTIKYLILLDSLDCHDILHELGLMAEKAESAILSPSDASFWYKKSFFYNGDSAVDIARIYENGIGVDRDDRTAFQFWHRNRIEHVHGSNFVNEAKKPEYYLLLGQMAFFDQGYNFNSVIDCWSTARIYWLKSLNAPHPHISSVEIEEIAPSGDLTVTQADALAWLGTLRFFGLGVRKNEEEALKIWLASFDKSFTSRYCLRSNAIPHFRLIDDEEKIKLVTESLKNSPVTEDNAESRWQAYLDDRLASNSFHSDNLLGSAEKGNQKANLVCCIISIIFRESEICGFMKPDFYVKKLSESRYIWPNKKLSVVERISTDNFLHETENEISKIMKPDDDEIDYSRNLFSTDCNIPLSLIEKLEGGKLPSSNSIITWVDFRLFLAELLDEDSVPLWSELLVRLQASSEALYRTIIPALSTSAHYNSTIDENELKAMSRSIGNAINSTGPDLNERDSQGFPIFRRAKNRSRWFLGRKVAAWDRVDRIAVDDRNISVSQYTVADQGFYPFISQDDIDVLAIIAWLEIGDSKNADLSVSLENVSADDYIPFQLRFSRVEFQPAQWLWITEVGQSMYYADTLLYLDRRGQSLRSNRYPYKVISRTDRKWIQPDPWRKAENAGGVRASSRGRNAFLVNHTRGETIVESNNTIGCHIIHIAEPLMSFDGSEEREFDSDRPPDWEGGRDMLRFYHTRHAAVLSLGQPEMERLFPVFRRVRLLFGIYAGLRKIAPSINVESELLRRLQRLRDNYQRQYERLPHPREIVPNY